MESVNMPGAFDRHVPDPRSSRKREVDPEAPQTRRASSPTPLPRRRRTPTPPRLLRAGIPTSPPIIPPSILQRFAAPFRNIAHKSASFLRWAANVRRQPPRPVTPQEADAVALPHVRVQDGKRRIVEPRRRIDILCVVGKRQRLWQADRLRCMEIDSVGLITPFVNAPTETIVLQYDPHTEETEMMDEDVNEDTINEEEDSMNVDEETMYEDEYDDDTEMTDISSVVSSEASGDSIMSGSAVFDDDTKMSDLAAAEEVADVKTTLPAAQEVAYYNTKLGTGVGNPIPGLRFFPKTTGPPLHLPTAPPAPALALVRAPAPAPAPKPARARAPAPSPERVPAPVPATATATVTAPAPAPAEDIEMVDAPPHRHVAFAGSDGWGILKPVPTMTRLYHAGADGTVCGEPMTPDPPQFLTLQERATQHLEDDDADDDTPATPIHDCLRQTFLARDTTPTPAALPLSSPPSPTTAFTTEEEPVSAIAGLVPPLVGWHYSTPPPAPRQPDMSCLQTTQEVVVGVDSVGSARMTANSTTTTAPVTSNAPPPVPAPVTSNTPPPTPAPVTSELTPSPPPATTTAPVTSEETPPAFETTEDTLIAPVTGERSESYDTTGDEDEDSDDEESEIIDSIVIPLTENEEAQLEAALAITENERKIKGELTRKDLETLVPQAAGEIGWLNDEIVNGYLARLVAETLKENKYDKTKSAQIPKYHAFSTHLYTTYATKGYAGVDRWAKRAKIHGERFLSTETVLIPINHGFHWTLLVIKGAAKEINYYDSLGGKGERFVEFGLDFVKGVLGPAYNEEDWSTVQAVSVQQPNAVDCGVFVCLNALAVMQDIAPADAFKVRDLQIARRMIAIELMK